MRTLIVTGTDTGVGKTYVAAAIARALQARGDDVVAVKPIETGCGAEPSPDEDGVILAEATGQLEPRRAVVRLREPVTPSLAADLEGVALEIDELARTSLSFAASADWLLLEGAGGALSPLAWDTDVTDFARRMGADARWILVAQDRLGCLHQIRATLDALASRGVSPRALVLSAPAAPDASTGRNAASLAKIPSFVATNVPVFEAPRAPAGNPRPVPTWVEDVLRELVES